MEKFPTANNEGNKRNEQEKKVILLLREKGIDDLETRVLFEELLNEKQEEFNQSGDLEGPLKFNFWLALFQFEAGFIDYAIESFNATLAAAKRQGGAEEFYRVIKDKMDELAVPIIEPGYPI